MVDKTITAINIVRKMVAEKKGLPLLAEKIGISDRHLRDFRNGGNLTIIPFLKLCDYLGLPLTEVLNRKGKPLVVDGTDLKLAAFQYLEEEENNKALKRMKAEIIRKLPWADLENTHEVRARALDPEVDCSETLKRFAEQETAWYMEKPQPDEIQDIEDPTDLIIANRYGPVSSIPDYIRTLHNLRDFNQHERDQNERGKQK